MAKARIEMPEVGSAVTPVRLAFMLDVSVPTVYRMYADGVFPEPICEKPLRWLADDIQAWAKTRVPGNWRSVRKGARRG